MTDLQTAKADPHCNELANVLAEARREARQVRSLRPELVPTTHDSGYAVNRMVVERLGWEPLGWKIAGTTAAVREKLKIDRPIYGRTFKRFATQSPATLLHRELLDPLIECEFFVTLADDLAPLLWFVEELRRWGHGLRVGEMISTGSTTGMLPIREGQHVRARFGADAGVEIMFKS